MNALHRVLTLAAALLMLTPIAGYGDKTGERDISDQRLDLMRTRAMDLTFRGSPDDFPTRIESEPLFRYDDLPRGYVDGTVWKLGATGRPLAIVTTELHPKYFGRPRVVYDLISLSEAPFHATSSDISSWSPPGSAITMQSIPDGPKVANSAVKRLFQLKQLARRFSAEQDVKEDSPDTQRLVLRLLPRPIDRYVPSANANSDGALFLFVAGRMPGVLMLIETDGQQWQFGIGRLSAPSTLTVRLDDQRVWTVPPHVGSITGPYHALNAAAVIP